MSVVHVCRVVGLILSLTKLPTDGGRLESQHNSTKIGDSSRCLIESVAHAFAHSSMQCKLR